MTFKKIDNAKKKNLPCYLHGCIRMAEYIDNKNRLYCKKHLNIVEEMAKNIKKQMRGDKEEE